MDIIFTSEKRPGSSGVVHIGTMEVEPGGQSIQVSDGQVRFGPVLSEFSRTLN